MPAAAPAPVGQMFGPLKAEKQRKLNEELDPWAKEYDALEPKDCLARYANALCAPLPRTQTQLCGMELVAGQRYHWLRNYFLVPSPVTSGTSVSLWLHLATWVLAAAFLAAGSIPLGDVKGFGGGRSVATLFAAVCSVCPIVAVLLLLLGWVCLGQKGLRETEDGVLPAARFPLLNAAVGWMLGATLLSATALVVLLHVQIASNDGVVLFYDAQGNASAEASQQHLDRLVVGLFLAVFGVAQLCSNFCFAALHFAL